MSTTQSHITTTTSSIDCKITDHGLEKIQPENDIGNKEYKLRLSNGTINRIDQLVSQMRYRMHEGRGECIYYIGVTDTGGLMGLTLDEYKETMDIFSKVVDKNHYSMTLLSEKNVNIDKNKGGEPRKIYEFLIREISKTNNYIDLKIAIAGQVDSGKSSTLGALMTGKYDNGRGSARLNVFNFSHEVRSGRTSSVGHHILGFDDKGNIITHTSKDFGKRTWPEIISRSSKVITFFDLCGHEKYLKTTIRGMTSQFPDLAIITIGANMGVTRMSKEHIFLCLSLNIPFIILITKIDICKNRQNILTSTIEQINKLIKKPPCRRVPVTLKSLDDIITTTQNFYSGGVTPIIHTSNVTGYGLDILTQFLNLVPVTPRKEDNKIVEFHIETTWSVPGVGTVVGGQLVSGSITAGHKFLIGPYTDGYHEVKIRSIQCKRVPLDYVEAGCYVTLGLQKVERKTIRSGQVILSKNAERISSIEFDAEVSIMKSHSTTIKIGYEPVVHTCSVRQTAKIVDIWNKVHIKSGRVGTDKVLRTGDRAWVRFRFSHHAEYIKPGFRILLAEGRVKVIGKIRKVL